MSRYQHSLCEGCWAQHTARNGEPDRQPVRVPGSPLDRCCGCRRTHTSGIYIQFEPERLPPCGGHGGTHGNDPPEDKNGIAWVDWFEYGGAIARAKPGCIVCGERATIAARAERMRLLALMPACDNPEHRELAYKTAMGLIHN